MIEWIVTSSALIVLVLLLRALVKGRVSPRLRYALWGLVLLRLLVPVSLLDSPVSVMTPVPVREVSRTVENIPREMPETDTLPEFPGWEVTPETKEARVWREEHGRRMIATEEIQRLITVRDVLQYTRLAETAALGVFLLTVNLKFYLGLKKRRQPAGKYRGRTVYAADGLSTPCLFGLLRPAIYLTPGLSEAEREHVLAHEYAHFRQGDHIWAALRGVCLALHWYNPLVWLAAYLSRRDCELSCDEGAVRLLGEASRADYGRTLVGLVARRTTPADLACCATTMTGGKSALKERVALLVKRPRTTAVMAVLVAAACVVFAACTFTGAAEAEEQADSENPSPPASQEPDPNIADPDGYIEAARELLLEYYGGNAPSYSESAPHNSQNAQDCRVNSVDLNEWQFDPDTGNRQASFYAEVMVLVPPEEHYLWMPGNTVEALEMEDDFYRDYDGWLVFWRQGYVVQDGASGDWRIPEMGTGGYSLDYMERMGIVNTMSGNYVRFRPLPEDLPTEISAEGDWWLLLAELEDTALYCNKYDTGTVYLRYGETFQVFSQDLSRGKNLLPEMTRVDDTSIAVRYRWENESTVPGASEEQVVYRWTGHYWQDIHAGISPQSDLPALEDLPDALIDVPGASQAPIWKVAELRSDDIAVYYEQETGRGLLRYGDALQALDLGGRAITTPRLLMPVLYFEDFDGDGEKELAMIYNSGSGTGVSVWSLTVFEWDGARWTEHTARLEEEIINDFNSSRTLALHPDENYATVSFHESRVDVDMDAQFGGRTLWKEEPLACEITGAISAYSRESYGLTLTLAGELRPESYHPTTSYAFSYTCCIYYDGDGAFHAVPGWLDAEYRWVPKADGSFLTPTFRDILLRFIDQCRAEGMEDLTTERYAICDVNGDGENELLIQRNNTSMAGQVERVYNIYGNELLAEYPGVTYYDNGYAQAGWSHNQGVAGDKLWPYTLYRTIGTGRDRHYTTAAVIDGWDRSIRDTYLSYDETVIPFPEEADKDGDGFVYYLITEAGGYAPVYGTPMDYAEYTNWAAVFLGANAVEVAYIPLTEENIALIQSN